MKSRRPLPWLASFTSIAVTFSLSVSTHAASDSWDGSTDTAWATGTNWLLDTTPPGAGETATFNGAGNGNTTIDLGAGVTIGSVVFDSASAAAYTIGSGAVGSQTLTLGSSLGNVITMNADVVNNQLFNSNLALSANSTANNTATYYALTNDSLTNSLNIAGGISASTAGVKTLRVTGSGNTNISGAITSGSGNVSIFKTGTGTLTLSGGATFSGNGITDGANFTTSTVFREGLTILNGGTYDNSNMELVIGGVATHGGAGTNTTLQVNNGTTLNNVNWLSIGRGNGNGTATSNLTLNGNATVSSANLSAGFNAGNAGNVPKGTVTLNGTSSISVTTSNFIAESAGSNFTFNVNDTSLFRQTAAGGGETRVGAADNAVGTINVNGGTVSFERDTLFGYAGTGTGRLHLTSGTVNMASTLERWLMLGRDGASKGEITVDGGTLNLNTNSDIRFGRNAGASGASFVTLNGGAITGHTGNANGIFSGGSVIDLNNSSTQAGFSSTFNLNGGTLTIGQVITNNNSGNAVFNFNGGTLRAAANSTAFVDLGGANQRANVRNGGAIIDTNGVNVTIVEALRHSNIDGDNAIDGGLTKQGEGILTLTGTNTYTGGTTLSAGAINFSNSSAFGTGAITSNGGTIRNTAGVTTTNNMVVNSATALDVTGGNWDLNGNISGNGNITRGTGANLSLYLGGDNSGYTGTFTSVNNGNAVVRFNSASAGSASGRWVFDNTTLGRTTLSWSGTGTISFGSMTGAGQVQTDVAGAKTISVGALGLNDTFSGTIANGTGTIALTKVGSGTMTLSGANTYTGTTTVSDGTLALDATGSIANSSEIALNGGNFNVSAVAGFSLGSGQSLTGHNGSVTGDITVNGTLAIGNSAGTMTFNNDLTIGASALSIFELTDIAFAPGTYDLAQGSQTVTFGGTLNLLFSGGTYADNTSVQIFDFGSYSGNFTTVNYSGLGEGQSAVFDASTGIVTVIPEPGPAALLGGFGLLALLRRRRR